MTGISCTICTETYKSEDAVYSTTCGHIYHYSCMQQWQSRSSTCPQCRHYNPQTHKIYLNIDESAENNRTQIKNLLEQTREQLEECKRDNEEKIVAIKSQFEQSLLNASNLEQELEQSERNFLSMQEQYNKKDEEIQEHKMKIEYLSVQLESKVPTSGNEHSNVAEINYRSDDGTAEIVWKQRVKSLEFKLKLLSAELEKEMRASAKLTAENMHLQSLLDQNSSRNTCAVNQSMRPKTSFTTKPTNKFKQNITTVDSKNSNVTTTGQKLIALEAQIKNLNQGERKELSQPVVSKTNDQEKFDINSVVIKGLSAENLQMPFPDVVLNLAKQMELFLTNDDIQNTFLKERHHIASGKALLVVKFKSLELKVKFLSNKEKLKKNPFTKDVIVHEYVENNTNVLFHHAKTLKTFGYRYVYCRNNKVYVRIDKNSAPMIIRNKKEVEMIKAIKNNENSTKPIISDETSSTCDQ